MPFEQTCQCCIRTKHESAISRIPRDEAFANALALEVVALRLRRETDIAQVIIETLVSALGVSTVQTRWSHLAEFAVATSSTPSPRPDPRTSQMPGPTMSFETLYEGIKPRPKRKTPGA